MRNPLTVPANGASAGYASSTASLRAKPAAVNKPIAEHLRPDQTPWPKASSAWCVVAILVFANALSFVDRMILSLLVAPIRASFQISDTQVSLLLGFAFVVFYIFMGLPLAWLADRYSRRNLIMGGVLVWSAMTACCGLAASYFTLFLARMGVGVGEAVLGPSATSLLSDYFPREKLGKAISIYQIGIPLGGGMALVISAAVLHVLMASPVWVLPFFGPVEAWRMIFLWVALPGLLVIVLLAMVKEPLRRGVRLAASGVADSTITMKHHLTHNARAVGALICGIALIATVLYGLAAWVPTFLMRTYGMSMSNAGLAFGSIMAVAGTTGLLSGGILADRMYRAGRTDAHMRVMLFAALLGIPLFGAAMLMPTATLGIITLTLAFFVLANYGAGFAALPLITPNPLRARTTAVLSFVTSLVGLGIGPTLIAVLTDYVFKDPTAIRYSMAIVGMVSLVLAVAIFSFGLAPYRRSIQEANERDH